MTIPQLAVLALAAMTILLPAGWILWHDLTRRPLDDRGLDAEFEQFADESLEIAEESLFAICFCDECTDLTSMTVCDRAAALEQQQRRSR